ncbi:4Fe-4S dicluster domain-containing protein [Rubeoparvulum massiliense]|uniref:4Fe-4S dicluster domain-containing protein n=1 Tax=Rubeoparvulum massiliense TaxID=1631346 RepID=UPI00065DD9B7|nr:4Fe-4S dicluster domain-containing protein [Rubeoparvulum massiliense]
MPRYGMLIDVSQCVGCFACRVDCQMTNSLPPSESFIKFYEKETGTYPNVSLQIFPVQCQHCEDAPCVNVCPTGASYYTEEGMVLVDHEKCIGCKYCMVACPYDARVVNEETGVVEKCRFCYEAVTAGWQPACVETCIGSARIFGDLDDPNSDISKAIVEKKAQQLRPDLGTKPKIFYVR